MRRPTLAVTTLAMAVAAAAAEPPSMRPSDPLYHSRGAWGQAFEDQWGLHRIGFSPMGGGQSAWEFRAKGLTPIVVAVIDSGLDYLHPDFRRDRLWRNAKETPNGRDDDGNGYVDDFIGWNFIENDNNPWDRTGHGTHVAGIIAAATNNGEGIAGVNPTARIMPVKALNFVGRGRSSGIARAILYAVNNGACVINLSLGGEKITDLERRAVAYASGKGVVVVVASGNLGVNTADFGFAALSGVITVAATDHQDRRAPFSNWGKDVKLAAPGVEVLSLRARRTDLLLVSRTEGYVRSSAFVGPENRYYRASGTSFAAPFVSAVASLILAHDPRRSAAEVTRMIVHSARDVETPGVDQHTGYGLLDARAALRADPRFFVEAQIDGANVAQEAGATVVRLLGTADADRFGRAWIEIGAGPSPTAWKAVGSPTQRPVRSGLLGVVPAAAFGGSSQWTVRLLTEHEDGRRREARLHLDLG